MPTREVWAEDESGKCLVLEPGKIVITCEAIVFGRKEIDGTPYGIVSCRHGIKIDFGELGHVFTGSLEIKLDLSTKK